MSKHFATGMAMAALCLVLAGCGGDGGGVSQSAHDQLQTELDAAKADLMELQEEAEADTTAEEADDKRREEQIAALTASLAEEETTATTETTTETETEEEEEETDTTATTTPTTPTTPATPATPTTQTAEASQRARNLMTAFGALPTGAGNAQTLADSPVDMSVRSRGSLRLERSGYSTATLGGTGLRSATMTLSGTGDTGKTVIYTDRELSRKLLDHYGSLRDPADMTRFGLETGALVITDGSIAHTTTPTVSTVWRISHDITASVAAVDGDDTDDDPNDPSTTLRDDFPATAATTKMKNSYTGYLHGLSGTFVCSVADCQVTVTVAETNYGSLTNGRYALQSVVVGTTVGTGTENLRFKPSTSATLQLYEGGPVGADTEYMVFGYWREDPASPAGVYQYSVFAEVEAATGAQAVPGTFSATYDGTAVGAYVEKDPGAAVDTYRQGEFTADVQLTATSATAVSGTIDDFVTMPTGGSTAPKTADRWVLTLSSTPATNTVSLGQLAGTTVGGWNHEFVPAHATAAAATPTAVVGVFDARIEDLVSIVGAFGAEKR